MSERRKVKKKETHTHPQKTQLNVKAVVQSHIGKNTWTLITKWNYKCIPSILKFLGHWEAFLYIFLVQMCLITSKFCPKQKDFKLEANKQKHNGRSRRELKKKITHILHN